jgi:hypothetical protein
MTGNTRRYEEILMAYPHDGLVDVMVGLALAASGLMLLADLPWMGPILVITFLFLLRGVKARWILPRLTQEELDEVSPINDRWAFIALAGGLTALLVLGIFALALSNSGALDDIGDTGWLVFAVGMLVLIIVGIGLITGQRHWFVHAVITAVLAGTAAALSLPFELGVSIVGLPILAYGIWMLWQFFSEHQLTPQ